MVAAGALAVCMAHGNGLPALCFDLDSRLALQVLPDEWRDVTWHREVIPMGWSLKLGNVAGIRVQVHFTFLIFMAWILLSGLVAGKSREVVLANAAFMLGLFGCVVLHELGHALTAKRYGSVTKDSTLLPIGGVAGLERMPEDPRQELWVALAGPAVNVVIAAGLGMWLYVTRGGVHLGAIDFNSSSFVERILLVNISLVVFNMLPAFPMD